MHCFYLGHSWTRERAFLLLCVMPGPLLSQNGTKGECKSGGAEVGSRTCSREFLFVLATVELAAGWSGARDIWEADSEVVGDEPYTVGLHRPIFTELCHAFRVLIGSSELR
ncbi:hypothetical protein EXIGLDRAFT_187510 [Exidia glandulosa HHB12029]|uniref:Secreted protein n=1 Tax=Exidia glandulosa HHB12029 TaxID=1314781 RepID=A0A165EYJ1_EXIGL|nr:hypothetical protein EXIGLDRAFT_187510 [Exidia glandulosa HHB12029]